VIRVSAGLPVCRSVCLSVCLSTCVCLRNRSFKLVLLAVNCRPPALRMCTQSRHLAHHLKTHCFHFVPSSCSLDSALVEYCANCTYLLTYFWFRGQRHFLSSWSLWCRQRMCELSDSTGGRQRGFNTSMYSHSPGGRSGPGWSLLCVDADRYEKVRHDVLTGCVYVENKLQKAKDSWFLPNKRRRLRVCSCYTDLHCASKKPRTMLHFQITNNF